jgi:hypothetical protein
MDDGPPVKTIARLLVAVLSLGDFAMQAAAPVGENPLNPAVISARMDHRPWRTDHDVVCRGSGPVKDRLPADEQTKL